MNLQGISISTFVHAPQNETLHNDDGENKAIIQ